MNRQCKGFVELWVGLYLTLKSQQHICGEKKKTENKRKHIIAVQVQSQSHVLIIPAGASMPRVS